MFANSSVCPTLCQLWPLHPGSSLPGHNKIIMTHRIEPFFGNVILMIFVLSLWYALSCRFESLAHAGEDSFAFLPAVVAKDLSLPLLPHLRVFSCGPSGASKDEFPEVFLDLQDICRVHVQFQLLSRIFQGFIEFLVFRIDVTDASQHSCIVELWPFLLSRLGFFLFAEISFTTLIKFLAICSRAWTLLES